MPTVSQVIARQLRELGVERAFGIPGGVVLPLLDAFRDEGIDFVLVRSETSAGFMADADAQLTGAIGCCIGTLGPGVTNLVNGVAGCLLDRAPVVVVTGELAASRRTLYTHQTLDQRAIMTPVVKVSVTLSAQEAARETSVALRQLVVGRPGPIHLNVPADVAQAETSSAGPPWIPGPALPHPTELDVLALRVAQASRPVILAGFGALDAPLDALAEAWRAPVLTTYKAKGVIDERSDWSARAFGLSTTADALHQAWLAQSDLVILVGLDPVELRPQWLPGWSAPAVVIDRDVPFDLSCEPETVVLGDVGASVNGLVERAGRTASAWTVAEVAAHRQAHDRLFVDGSLGPATAVRAIQAGLPADAILALDVGAHRITAAHVWRCGAPNRILQSNGLSSMGYGLPAAIAAKLAEPGRVCVALTGDAGLWMALGELGVVQDRGLDLVVVYLSDASLALIEHKQRRMGLADTGVRFTNPDVVALGQAFGGTGVRVSGAEITPAVQAAVAAGGLQLIEVVIDREPYAEQV